MTGTAHGRVVAYLEGLDVERLINAIRPVTRHLRIGGGDAGYEKWLRGTAAAIAHEYAATPTASPTATGEDK